MLIIITYSILILKFVLNIQLFAIGLRAKTVEPVLLPMHAPAFLDGLEVVAEQVWRMQIIRDNLYIN